MKCGERCGHARVGQCLHLLYDQSNTGLVVRGKDDLFRTFPFDHGNGLHDASMSRTSGLGIWEQHIEVTISNQRVRAAGGFWCWTNILRPLADGLTNTSARQWYARLPSERHSGNQYDPDYVAAEKQREATQRMWANADAASERSRQGWQPHNCRLSGCDQQVGRMRGTCCGRIPILLLPACV